MIDIEDCSAFNMAKIVLRDMADPFNPGEFYVNQDEVNAARDHYDLLDLIADNADGDTLDALAAFAGDGSEITLRGAIVPASALRSSLRLDAASSASFAP
jgi:hypothetical protein